MTIRQMADALEMAHSTYAAYEDQKKFKKPILPFNMAKRIAGVLEKRGISRAEVMQLAGLEVHESAATSSPPGEKQVLMVTGAVAAGVWREQSDWSPEEWYPLEVGPSPVPGERFALRMEGHSMDRTIPPGSELECLRVAFGSTEPRPGDLVIVERQAHDLTEMTCKRLDLDGEVWVLRMESTMPQFQEVIRLGKPSEDLYLDVEIRVVGIVLKSHQSHFRGLGR